MKSRLAWYFLVAVLAAVGAWAVQHQRVTRRVSPVAHAEVAIQDGKTIDFSSGTPVVKDDAAEKAAIDRSVAAMDAAAAQVSFTPGKPAPVAASTAVSETKR
jgi:hypothetical protein